MLSFRFILKNMTRSSYSSVALPEVPFLIALISCNRFRENVDSNTMIRCHNDVLSTQIVTSSLLLRILFICCIFTPSLTHQVHFDIEKVVTFCFSNLIVNRTKSAREHQMAFMVSRRKNIDLFSLSGELYDFVDWLTFLDGFLYLFLWKTEPSSPLLFFMEISANIFLFLWRS